MRPKIVVANWKMNQAFDKGLQLAAKVVQILYGRSVQHTAQVILLPPFIHLDAMRQLLPTSGYVHLGAQNCHEQAFGPFTGEIAAPMLRSVGARFVLVGHSERREYFGEDSMLLAQKVTIALLHGLRPIFCCGESHQTRLEGHQEPFVHQQLSAGLFHLSATQIAQVVIAYEPVWAIGTGNTPIPTQIQSMHKSIRTTIAHQYGKTLAQSIPILYGGSCDAENAHTFFACADVDGGLIGKASLEVASFIAIVNALE